MNGEPQPYCEACIVPLTVLHIIAECHSLADIRRRACSGVIPNEPENCLKLIIGDGDTFEAARVVTLLSEAGLLVKI